MKTPRPLPPLSEAQQEIMEIVWEAGDISASDVRRILEERRPIARTTVQTLMKRMVEKGWLRHREEGRTHLFSASVPREASLGAKAKQLIDSAFGGSAESLMTALLEHRGLSKKEAANIRRMLDDADAKRGRGRRK